MAIKADQVAERARELLAPVAAREGCELLDLRLVRARGWTLQLVIDRPEGVTVGDCARVSRAASALLDEDEELLQQQYVLEVTSPGIDRPLFGPEDYDRFAGQQVKLELVQARDGRRKFSGVLLGRDEGEVQIEVEGEPLRFALESIRQARLDPEITIPASRPEPRGQKRRLRKQRGRS